MGTNTVNEDMNPILEEVVGNLDSFIENINCLRETYDFSKGMLNQQLQSASKNYESFIAPFRSSNENGNCLLEVPLEKIKEFKKLFKKKCRAEKAFLLIPPSYIVTLVSLYDTFLAGYVRCIYSLKESLILESNISFSFRDIAEYGSIKEVKKNVIDNTIDKLFRDSHTEQIDWIEKAIDVKTLKQFAGWSSFVELTERRNLFVHSDGMVSSQYLKECKKCNYDTGGIEVGSKLLADDSYFENSYKLLYEMSVMMTQILLNKLYIGVYTNDTGVRDKILIGNVYELISEKLYDVAIAVSMFARDGKNFKHNNKDRTYIELNLAQAYKWSGQNDKCLAILRDLDTSAMNLDLKIPKKVLEEKYDEVYIMMQSLGACSDILTKEAYREWPIFKEIRNQEKFKDVFEIIFSEHLLLQNTSTSVESSLGCKDEISSGEVELFS